VNPAKVDAKLNIEWGVAGVGGEGLERCFPPTPRAMMEVIKTGIQAILSYLLKEEKLKQSQTSLQEKCTPIQDIIPTKRD